MVRFGSFPTAFALAALGVFTVSGAAQASDQNQPAPPKMKVVSPKSQNMSFPWNSLNTTSPAIEIRPADQLSQKDHDLLGVAEPMIAEQAGLEGMEFNEGNWTPRQIVCTSLPAHLFLRFTRNEGAGDVSEFSASVPRNGQGRIRVIPIERRGYSLFSPAPINPVTIAAFNAIRAEEPPGEEPSWLGIGLCYAALAGANPHVGEPDSSSDPEDLAAPPSLRILKQGALVGFVDTEALPRPMKWTLMFDAKGKLIKASLAPSPSPIIRRRPIASAGP